MHRVMMVMAGVDREIHQLEIFTHKLRKIANISTTVILSYGPTRRCVFDSFTKAVLILTDRRDQHE
jgi:hypothetical protein